MANSTSDILTMVAADVAPCQKKFEFTIAAEAIKAEAAKTARQIAGMVSLPGFRKGKAPASMIMQRYASEVKEELGRRLVSAAFDKLSADKSLEIVACSMADTPEELKLDAEFKFTLQADLAPEVSTGEYVGLRVVVPEEKVEEAAVEERLDYYRKMYGNYAEIEGPAQAEDMLKVSYTSDFELPEGASPALQRQVKSDENWLWLNEPEFLPGAIAALTGAEVGKEYTFASTYPADWRDSELAGRTVQYTVKVNGIQRRQPLSDAELCEKVKVDSIEELRESLKKSMENEAQNTRHGKVLEKVYEVLNAQVPEFTIPAGVLQNESEKILRSMAQEKVKTEADGEQFKAELDQHKQEAEKQAAEKLRRTFIFRKIAQAEKIVVTRNDVDMQIRNMSRYYGYKEKDFRKMLEKSGGMDELQLDILNGKVWEFLAAKADVSAN
ncbi:trigger factor [Victivallis sp. Marseille-Q1083]|uniref:trigger factor n=1 Tax=Victivallis sp. Marseille-Q1083 TaxID=2717288 RepID=UPI00158A6E0D|nr:trigger factor [Victivallis sp. Marseille-Q1083]